MNGKRINGREYKRLLNKLWLQILGLFLGSIVLVIGARICFRGHFADTIVNIYCFLTQQDWYAGQEFYWYYVLDNLVYIIIAVIVIAFLILLRLAMMLFTRYFDQIIAGVDQLAQESDEPITLKSPELDFMQKKLTEVQSRLRQRTEQAQAAEQRKNDLIVYLAHDIKTPLTSVIGYLSLLDEGQALPEAERARFTHIALEKAYRLEGLINEFFEITRYHFQTMPLDREKVDLCYMMVQISDELYPKLKERGKTMELDVPENMTIYADTDKMARVFNNILKNAIAYSADTGPIRVSAWEEAGQAVIRFISPGAIPREKLDDIFEKFYRLDASRSSATGGAGLGLAIARDIVRLHGGEVTAQSDDSSTTFTVILPQKGDNENGTE